MKNITVEELKKRLDAGEQLHIIDVREPSEYADYNIGGTLFPLGKVLSMQLEDLDEWKNEELIVHCKAGGRSIQACMVLEQVGFTNVVNLVGGTIAWKQKFG
ncbi:MAG: rhodanese-like domain-containing protein [Legionellales bacterium]